MLLPSKTNIIEVGPRDGFQNIETLIPTEIKIKIIGSLIESGIKEMEITSFVHPKLIPQMSDASEVVKHITKRYGGVFRPIALVPNIKGAENALKAGIRTITYVLSVSEKHNMKNVNKSVTESLEELRALIDEYPELTIRLSLATVFGCPFAGTVPVDDVVTLVEKVISFGISEITLCDTIGTANPKQVSILLDRVKPITENIRLGLHFHDTRGMGLANTLSGLLKGVTSYETSIGGLGGCPFAPGAAGNTASEDTVNMLQEMGITTGIDLPKLLDTSKYIKNNIDAVFNGRLVNICKN